MRRFRLYTTTTRSIKFEDLGKNYVRGPPLPPLNVPQRTKGGSMIQYIDSIMKKYPDSVVLTQVGGFYEIYFESALEFGPKLEFKVAQKRQRNPRTGDNWVPMIGFPISQLSRYTQLLVQDWGKNVVILTQQQEHILSKSSEELKRPIARIVTPGTIVDDELVNSFQHNYIACLWAGPSEKAAIAWVDLADSSLYYQTTTKKTAADDLARLNPREVVVDSKSDYAFVDLSEFHTSPFRFPLRDALLQHRILINHPEKSLRNIVDSMPDSSVAAVGALLGYINEALPGGLHRYTAPKEYIASDTMKLDRFTIKALELFRTEQRDETIGSLMWVIRRTKTASGSRLLQKMIAGPTRNKELINYRLDMVELFLNNTQLRMDSIAILRDMPDARRAIHKLGSSKVNTKELLKWVDLVDCIERFIAKWDPNLLPEWLEVLERSFEMLKDTRAKIKRQVNITKSVPNPLLRPFESHLFETATPKFKRLVAERLAIAKQFDELNIAYQEKFRDVGKASIRYTPQLGYHCTLKFKKGPAPTLPQEDARILTQATTTMSFDTEEITDLGNVYEACLLNLEKTQRSILDKLRKQVLELSAVAHECADIIDKADVFQGFATLAVEWNLSRPVLVDEPTISITKGRNLIVEAGLESERAGPFISNDTQMSPDQPMYMITGPNMGGKSTYLRQVAYMCLLAQIGSFVPAEKAVLGVVDRIFCRLGSSDDITRGRSTFMVELLEVSTILRSATTQSLALMDEVGRGTSQRDGTAVAYATMKYMIEVNKCRSIFTTHFGPALHQALSQVQLDDKVKFMKTRPIFGGKFIEYDHRLIEGVCGEAHGLDMARLAGYPQEALEKARQVYPKVR